jgi:transcriptional regulator with XRE-family HTH domain
MRKQAKKELVALVGEAIRSHRLAKKMTVAELAADAGISKNSVSNIEHGVTRQMREANAREIAKALGVPLEEIATEMRIEAKNPALGALGLIEIPSAASDEEPFQSLMFSRVNQPLSHIWYDYRTENLSLEATDKQLLKCCFTGGKSSMASNFALHPENHTPRELTPRQQAIGFSARIEDNPTGAPLSLAVRLVDKKGREWVLGSKKVYAQKHEPHLFQLDSEKSWIQCIIHLTPYPTALHTWYLFRTTSADRSPNLKPDWSVLSRIVVEIGEVADIGHPAAHSGTVLITPIWLGTPVTLAEKLPVGKSASITKATVKSAPVSKGRRQSRDK